jgi:hypothetical protein
MVTYDSPLMGQTHIRNVREQIQEDIRAFIDVQENSKYLVLPEEMTDDLCQIVVDNFKTLEKE